jgi:type 1 fimbriae regulatory protein FimB/type 1 fimbriae regulatory protein FimE
LIPRACPDCRKKDHYSDSQPVYWRISHGKYGSAAGRPGNRKSDSYTQAAEGDELRALRRLAREQGRSEFAFVSERGAPFSAAGFAKLVERAGEAAKLGFKAHPHMLRHACGYKLANDGVDTRSLQAYLGHRNIQHTVRYSELSPARFKNFWRD